MRPAAFGPRERLTIKPALRSGWVAFCAALAALFIFDHLGARSFWLDEASTANLIPVPLSSFFAKAAVDGCPFLYGLLLKLWAAAFGDGETALRGLSAFFAIACIPMLYLAASELFDETTGLFAAFIGATNYFLIFFGTQSKSYTLGAFAGLVSFYYFHRCARGGRTADSAGYLIASALSLYLHPWLFLAFGGQILSLLAFRRLPGARRTFLMQAAVLALAVPNILVTLYQGKLQANAWMEKPSVETVLRAFVYLSYGSSWIYLAATLGALAFRFFRKEKGGDAFTYASLAVYLLLPPVAAAIVSQFSPAYVPARYEMIVLPAFLLLLADGWSVFRRFVPAAAVLAVLLTVAAARQVVRERETVAFQKASDRTDFQALLGRIKDGDVVVASDLSYSTAAYYFRRFNTGPAAVRFELLAYPAEMAVHPSWRNFARLKADPAAYQEEAARFAADLKRKTGQGHTVWLICQSGGPFTAALVAQLREAFLLFHEERMPAPRQPSWFDSILTFRN